MKRFKLDGRRIAIWVAVCGGVSASLSLLNTQIGCRSTLTALGESIPNNFNANASCTKDCGCESVPLYPVCDNRGTVFYSPCHAGCPLNAHAYSLLNVTDSNHTPFFEGCKCAGSSSVSRDLCKSADCDWKWRMYLTNMAFGGMVGGLGVIPGILILLRSVPPRHRSVSLGFNGFLVSLLATLPSPIAWGSLVDYFCIYWEKKCSVTGRGACSLYAADSLRVWMYSIYGALRLISLLTDIFVIYHAKGLKITDEDGEKGEEGGENHKAPSALATNQMELEKLGGEGEGEKEQGAPPLEKKKSHHSRSGSKDLGHTPQSLSPRRNQSGEESNLWRKSSSQLPGPIADI